MDGLTKLDAIERRLGDINISAFDDLPEIAVEKREQQRADVRAVNVGIGHDDDLVIAQIFHIEFLADRGADRDDKRADFGVREHLVEPRALNI